MYIPQKMTNKIASVFYDKTIEVLTPNVITDAEGGVNYKGLATISSFNGNVSFSNCKKVQEEYGLDYEIDISVTASVNTNVSINDIIKYQNITYNVTDILPSDSHILIVATKWRQ